MIECTRRSRLAAGTTVLLLLVVTACSTNPENSSHNEYRSSDGADYAAYRTYAWLEKESAFTRAVVLDDSHAEANEQRLRDTIEKTLNSKGYGRAADVAPDFFYAYQAAVFKPHNPEVVAHDAKRQREELLRERSAAGPEGVEAAPERITLYSGTLLLQIFDGRTGKVVWSGSADNFVNSFRGTRASGRQTVRTLLAEFPSR